MLTSILLKNFRCFADYHQDFSQSVVMFHGKNGAGKTSILEAIHHLFTGRSFRSVNTKDIVLNRQELFVVSGQLDHGGRIGIQKSRNDKKRILKVDGVYLRSLSELVDQFPSRALTPESYKQILSPGSRRQWLDWIVFHVEHLSHSHYQIASRILKQRNALLKKRQTKAYSDELKSWDHALISSWLAIDGYRKSYVETMTKRVNQLLVGFDLPDITFSYQPGWPCQTDAESLQQLMHKNIQRDLKTGFTNAGINKADLKIKVYNSDAQDILSRGQLKILIHLINLVLIEILQSKSNTQPFVFYDDAFEEIDSNNQNKLFKLISNMNYRQAFFSSVEVYKGFNDYFDVDVFHVEH
jgi:DNA replication and repair protein RecF